MKIKEGKMLRKISIFLITAAFAIGINSLSYAMSCCDASSESGHHQKVAQVANGKIQESTTKQVDSSKKEVNVGNKICPVTGEKINENTKVTYEYQGKIYNFCCAGCPDEFKKNPEKYIKKVNEELQARNKEAASEGEKVMPESGAPSADIQQKP